MQTHQTPARRPAMRKAFTLIELLVVISIIALLVAILLPALQAARATAQSAACLSNLRQVAIASNSYASDFDGRLPKTANRGATHGHALRPPATSGSPNVHHGPGMLVAGDYLPSTPVGSLRQVAALACPGGGMKFGIYNSGNGQMPYTWRVTRTTAFPTIEDPRPAALMTDRYYMVGTNALMEFRFNHASNNNVVFSDGSAKSLLDDPVGTWRVPLTDTEQRPWFNGKGPLFERDPGETNAQALAVENFFDEQY